MSTDNPALGALRHFCTTGTPIEAVDYATITPYGPGKFDYNVDVVAYGASLDCADATEGDCQEYGECFSLVTGDFASAPDDRVTAHLVLSDADMAFLRAHRGAVVCEDSQGFVSVEWFATEREARTQWARVEAAFAAEADDDTEELA